MLQSFTRNYKDNSTDAGFQFTFYCDVCKDGFNSSFVQSDTYKKRGLLRGLGTGASIAGSLVGGRAYRVGYAGQRATSEMSRNFDGKSPEWIKEHEKAFERCQNEAQQHFKRCPNCNSYVCDHCWNEDATLCTKCAPRQEVYVAKTAAQAMKRNIDQAGSSAVVWQGKIEGKTTICPSCGKPAGAGKFCNNCGENMEGKECPQCGAKNQPTVRFCNNCGLNLAAPPAPPPPPAAPVAAQPQYDAPQPQYAAPPAPPAPPQAAANRCAACGTDNAPGMKFCGNCGAGLSVAPSPPPVATGKCLACGTDNAPDMKFCGNCGNKLGQ
jgi:hypothetical protein